MDIFDAPLAILGFLGLVAVAPAWFWMTQNHSAISTLGPASQFMLNMLFPAIVLIYLASWIEGGASV